MANPLIVGSLFVAGYWLYSCGDETAAWPTPRETRIAAVPLTLEQHILSNESTHVATDPKFHKKQLQQPYRFKHVQGRIASKLIPYVDDMDFMLHQFPDLNNDELITSIKTERCPQKKQGMRNEAARRALGVLQKNKACREQPCNTTLCLLTDLTECL